MIAVLVLLPLMAASQGVPAGYRPGNPYGPPEYNPYQPPRYGGQQLPQFNPNAGYSPQPTASGQQQPGYGQPPYVPQQQVSAPQQQGYTPQQQGSAPQQQGFAPQQQGYTPQQHGSTPQQQGYVPQQQGSAPQQQGYVPQQQGYSPQQQGSTPQQQDYAPQQQGSAPQQQGYVPQQQGNSPQQPQPPARRVAKSPDSFDSSGFPDIGSLKGFGNVDDFGNLGKGRVPRENPFTINLFDKPSAAQSLVGRSGHPSQAPQRGSSAPQQGTGAPGQSDGAPSQDEPQIPAQAGGYPGPNPYPRDPYPSNPYSKGKKRQQPPSQPAQSYDSQGQELSPNSGGDQNSNSYPADTPVGYSNAAPTQYPRGPAAAPSQPAAGRGSGSLSGNNPQGGEDASALLPPVPSLYPAGLSFKQPSKPGVGGSAPASQPAGYNPGGPGQGGGRPTNPFPGGSGGQVPPSPFGQNVNFQGAANPPAQSSYLPGQEVARGTQYSDAASNQNNQVHKNQNAYDQNDGYSKANQGGYSNNEDYANQKSFTNGYSDGKTGGSADSYQNKNVQTDAYRNKAASKQNLGYDQKTQYDGGKPAAGDGEVTYEAPVESDSKSNLPPINGVPLSANPTPLPAPAVQDSASQFAFPQKPPAPSGGGRAIFVFPPINKRRPGQTNIFGDEEGFSGFGNTKSLL